jgi:hypothetical protein
MIRIGHRFMTGQACTTTGEYEFDGYTDTSSLPCLSLDEQRLVVNAGSAFPTASGEVKSAYWRFVGWPVAGENGKAR